VNQGTTAESLNLAMVWQLPVIFVVEDNGWGEATSSEFATAGDIVKRAQGYGMRAEKVDGLSVSDVYEATRAAVEHAARATAPPPPHRTERFYGHFNGDTDSYRSDAFKAEQRANRDCLRACAASCPKARWPRPPSSTASTRGGGRDRIRRPGARAAEQPESSTLTTDVYVSYEGRL
jgi:pyruvate dehydrogenase E1 component alpha subunit